MARKDPYVVAPKQSQIPKQLCERAVWYLDSLGRDLRLKRNEEKFKLTWDAFLRLNIPIECKISQKGGLKKGACFCYPPLSGLAGKRRKKGGKRR